MPRGLTSSGREWLQTSASHCWRPTARLDEFATAHGLVRTPAFMPVGTQGTVKGVHTSTVRATSADIILGDT